MTQRRTMQDFAHQMRWLVDEAPEVPVIQVVLEISTPIARRPCTRRGGRSPADCETVGVLQRMRRRKVQALVTERNATQATINWQFNTQDARSKLHRLYLFERLTDY